MEIFQFILSSAWNFIGTVILIFVICANIANILKSFKPVQIKYETKRENVESHSDYKKMWSDLISTWNKNKNPGDDKK
jgi:hypothetical protein